MGAYYEISSESGHLLMPHSGPSRTQKNLQGEDEYLVCVIAMNHYTL